MVLHQHEAAQFRAEMAREPLGQWSQDGPPVGRHPALAQVTVAEITRSCTGKASWPLKTDPGGTSIPITFSSTLTRGLILPRPRRFASGIGFAGAVPLVHAARFDVRAALQAFQARDLFVLFGDRLLQCGDLGEQFHQQGFKLWTA